MATFLLLGSAVLAVAIGQEAAGPDSAGDARDSARVKRAQELEQQLAELEQRLQRVSQQADDLLGRAGRARASARLQERRVEQARRRLEDIRMALGLAEDDVTRIETRQVALRSRLVTSARALHRFGDLAQLRLFFSLRRQTAPLSALRQLRYLTLRDAHTLALLRDADQQLQEQRSSLAEQRDLLADELEAEARLSRQLSDQRREVERLSRKLEERRRRLQEQTSGLRTRSERLAKLVDLLAREGRSGLSQRPIQEFRGSLDWPVEGSVAVGFGPRVDPKYGTRVMHNGVELEAELGAGSAAAVYPGRVIFAAPFQDLGYAVVLQHEQDVLTLYAGLREVLVAEGDVLLSGDRLGEVDERLYFEVRLDRKPEDPLDWLR